MDFSESSRVRRFLISSAESYNRFNGMSHNGYGGRQCFYDTNNLHIGSLMRALISNLELWVVNGEEPLASIYPKISDETLVELM